MGLYTVAKLLGWQNAWMMMVVSTYLSHGVFCIYVMHAHFECL